MIEALQRYCDGYSQADSVPTSPFELQAGNQHYTAATDGYSYVRVPYIGPKDPRGTYPAAQKKILELEQAAIPIGTLDIATLKELAGNPPWSKAATRLMAGVGKVERPMNLLVLDSTYFNTGHLARVLHFWPDTEPTGVFCRVPQNDAPIKGGDAEWVEAVTLGSRPMILSGHTVTICLMPLWPPNVWGDLKEGIPHRITVYPTQHFQKYDAA